MKSQIFIEHDCLIYPGLYVPRINEEDMETPLLMDGNLKDDFPPITVTELNDIYKVEVKIPGLKNENILIHADDNILSFTILKNEQVSGGAAGTRRSKDYNYQKYYKKMALPVNADPEYCRAEYKSDVLTIYVMKTKEPINNLHARIVVY